MAVTAIEHGDRTFRVVPKGIYRALSSQVTGFTVPYSAVTSVEHDPTFARRSGNATSSPGVSIPFLLKAGTYITNRDRSFWLRRRAEKCITIRLRGHEYDYLCIEVDDPEREVARMREAMAPG